MAPTRDDYDDSIMNQTIGVGTIVQDEGNPAKSYLGSMPFKADTEVYVLTQETFHELIKDSLRILNAGRITIAPDVVKLMPDEIDFKVIRDDSQDTVKLYLDRHFYTHDIGTYVYARYASMDLFVAEEELVNYEGNRNVPRIDPIEDSVIVRDDFRKAKGLKGKTESPECLNDNRQQILRTLADKIITPEDVYGGNEDMYLTHPPISPDGKWFYDGIEWIEIEFDEDDFDDDIDPELFWDRWRNR